MNCLDNCVSSSPVFLMTYSAYKLNKEGNNIQPWRTPFPIWNQSVVPRPVLTVASWPAYRFHRRQVRWSGIPYSLRIFQFVEIHKVKDFGVVNKAEIVVFLELSCFFHDPADAGNLISCSLQQYVNRELLDVQAGFRKGRGTRDQISTSAGSSKMQ